LLTSFSFFGRTIPGVIADRVGRFNVVNVMSYFSAAIVLGLWLPARANAPILVFAGLYGFSSGAFVSMGPALIAQISDIRKIGVRQGTLFAIISIAALTGSPIGGALVDEEASNPFLRLQIFCGVMMIGGSVFFTIARIKLAGFSLKAKV
jgi:MFS family permease